MIPLTLAEVATAVGGRLVSADPRATVTGGVEFDSRKVGPGDLFVAFPGERVDGHDFAAAAVAAGAVAVLGTRPVTDPAVPMVLLEPAGTAQGGAGSASTAQGGAGSASTAQGGAGPAGAAAAGAAAAGEPGADVDAAGPGDGVQVTQAAMGRLARYAQDRLPRLTVVGITGSSGKTTTKDLIGALLSGLGPTVAPPGSLNNELGHPYTALRAGVDTRFLVLEMGARGLGHLNYLCDIAPPRIGVVLNVGVAHLGEFGSVEQIAQAKGELVERLPADGLAVLNADDPRVRAMAGRTAARVVLVGQAPDATIRAEQVRLDERGRASFLLTMAGPAPTLDSVGGRYPGAGAAARPAAGGPPISLPVQLSVPGRHQVGNSLAAAAVALAVGATPQWVAAALGTARLASDRRMDVFDRPDGVTVIDDSYNANPASTAAALHALAAVGLGRRTVAVLGYMAELGEHERAGHVEIGELAARLGVDRLVVVEDAAAAIHQGAVAVTTWGGESVQVPDQNAAVALLRAELRRGDVVLVKGSRYRTWQVADALRAGGVVGAADALRAGGVVGAADALRAGGLIGAVDALRAGGSAGTGDAPVGSGGGSAGTGDAPVGSGGGPAGVPGGEATGARPEVRA